MTTPPDAEIIPSPNWTSQNLSPARGYPRARVSQVCTLQSGARGRSLRSACNFCHEKRVKCVTTEGKSRCEQCRQRDATCIFSVKGKTGPKPRGYRSKPGTSRYKRRKTTRWFRRESSAYFEEADASTHSESENPPECHGNVVATPVAGETLTGRRERYLLGIYIRSIGNFLPLVEPEVLVKGLQERQRLPQVMATAFGVDPLSYVQAQVAGAISLGALISGDLPTARTYHNTLNYHNNAHISTLIDPMTAPSLGLGTLYWQYLGDDQLKDYWLRQTRRVLCKAKDVPIDLVLCIEYLNDYSRETYERPGIEAMTPGRRTLHTISCLLANMYHVLNPVGGKPTAVAFCGHLGECIRDLKHEAAMELALLLCTSLQALLLVMIGNRQAAIEMLSAIPHLLAPQSDGTPSVARALPLCWDAVVIAAALSFLLGQDHIYRQLRFTVDSANDVSPAARWAFCLPDPDSDPRSFIGHECHSTSNICTILSNIAHRTRFGIVPFYLDDQSFTHPFPTLEMLTNQQQGAGYLSRFHSSVFGEDCMALRNVPPNDWDLVEENGQRLLRELHSMSPSRLSFPLSPGGGVMAGGMQEKRPLERVPSEGAMDLIDSSLGGLHGDIGQGRGISRCTELSNGAGNPGFIDGRKRYPAQCLSSFKTSSSLLCHTRSTCHDRDWREGAKEICDDGGDYGGHGTAVPCDDLGRELLVTLDGFGDDDDTFENIMSVEAMLENIEVESDINGGIEDEGATSLGEPFDTAKGFRRIVGEVGTRLLEKRQGVGRPPTISQRDNPPSNIKSSSASHATIGGVAVNKGPEMK